MTGNRGDQSDSINKELEKINKKLDEELDNNESWKYISTGAVGGALQGGLQLIGFSFDQRGHLNTGDPIPSLKSIPVGLEWIIYFLIISMAGAVLGSMASIFIIGDITKKNLQRVCVLSAAFGLFFPTAFDFISAYIGDQVVINNQRDANDNLSAELFELTEEIASEPNLGSTKEVTKKTIESYESLIQYTSEPKILENSRQNLKIIGNNNEDNLEIKDAVESSVKLENKNLLLRVR